MKRSERLKYTSNEFLARKKNVSEEVKLREALSSLNCRMSLTKDAIRQDVGIVKTELRQLRRSTGHSIEALPPTPFRLLARRHSIMPTPLPDKDYLSSYVPPEFHYILDELCDSGGEEECMESLSKTHKLPPVDSTGAHRQKTPASRGETVRIVTFHEGSLGSRESTRQGDEKSPEGTTHLPPLPHHENSPATVAHNKDLLAVPDWEVKGTPNQDMTQFQRAGYVRETSESSLTPSVKSRRSLDQSPDISRLELSSNEGSTTTGFKSPVSKQLMSILSEGEWKRREYVRKNSIVGFDSVAGNLVARGAMGSSYDKNFDVRHGADHRVPVKDKSEDLRAYRDARTRCRTCMARFRQNAAFQKQKLEQEMQAARQIQFPLDRKGSMGNPLLQKGLPTPDSDNLEQYLSDGVLDFEDGEKKPTTHDSIKKTKRKGYSRRRLNELAEPRKGTKRKTLFSKRLITKVSSWVKLLDSQEGFI